jgi:hypothetical protein
MASIPKYDEDFGATHEPHYKTNDLNAFEDKDSTTCELTDAIIATPRDDLTATSPPHRHTTRRPGLPAAGAAASALQRAHKACRQVPYVPKSCSAEEDYYSPANERRARTLLCALLYI